MKKWLSSNFVDCKIFYKYGCKLRCKLTCKLTIMAKPRLNRNGLWVRIFGKIFRKIVGKSKKLKKIAKIFVEIFQKIAEIFQKIVEIFQKIVEKIVENLRKPPKTSPPTYKSARNPKKFSSRFA